MSQFRDKFDYRVWEIVASIPSGRVMGYGEVARAAGFPRYSRMVSAAMGRSPNLAFEEGSSAYREQAQLLKQEGVRFDGLKIIEVETDDSLDRILWGPTD
jgi:methylated-DNA-protein-cysteine methyltransferase-like protein